MMDQLRFDALGYSSNGKVETPALDWLAGMGTVFTHAYTPAPSCIPARACLMTGQKPWTTGVLFTGNSAGPHLPGGVMGVNFEHTIPEILARDGYHTEGIGKMHFFPQRATLGFSHTLIDESGREEDKNFISDYKEWFMKCNPDHDNITDHGIHWNSWMARPFHADECYHPSNWTANECLNFLNKRDPSKPFFLKMSFARPHSPYDPSQYFFDMYKERNDLPTPFTSQWSEEYADVDDNSILTWHGKRPMQQIMRARAAYYGSVTQTDYQIAKLLTTLNKAKLLDEMLIIFTSDHGDMLGDHNLWRKTYAYEGSSHIPMIVKLPKSMAKDTVSVCDAPVSLYDILPTVLDVCNQPIPEHTEGMSLVPLINGNTIGRSYVEGEHFESYSHSEECYYVTDGKYKYVWLYRTGQEKFFDLTENATEERDEIGNIDLAPIIQIMRSYAIGELKKRNSQHLTFVKDGTLVPLKPGLVVSPHYLERLESSSFKWMPMPETGRN